MIRIRYAELDADSERALADADPADDPPAYRARLTAMTSPAARARSRAGLALLAAARQAPSAPDLAALQIDDNGRPQWPDGPTFSISHSGRAVVCALGETALGIDIERRRSRRYERIARLLGEAERAAVATDPGSFFDYWCAREATVKASGRVGLARIRALTIDGARAYLDGRAWQLQWLAPIADHACCLATAEPAPAIEISRCCGLDWPAENTGP